jgi:hypothetical protein
MSTLQSSLAVTLAATLANTVDGGSVQAPLRAGKSLSFDNGTASGQANQAFIDSRQIAASGTDPIDLSGVLTNALGASVLLTKVKALVIVADAANVNDVVVGGAASNGFATPFGDPTDKVKVPPGGVLVLAAPAAGFTVTPGTGDILQIANGGAGTAVNYTIAVIGVA